MGTKPAAKTAKKPAPKKPAPKKSPPKQTANDALDAMIAKAVRGDRTVRTALRDESPAAVVPRLVTLFADDSAPVRANAIGLATGILPFAKLVPIAPLVAALADPDASVRLAVVMALKHCFPIEPFYKPHAAKIAPALAACLTDSDKAVKEHAGHASRLLGLG